MFTVIFVNKRAEQLRENYQFLFQPLLDAEEMCFCPWIEDGKAIQDAVPDLYRLIRGKKSWRAIILNVASVDSGQKPDSVSAERNEENSDIFVADARNPYDFREIVDAPEKREIVDAPEKREIVDAPEKEDKKDLATDKIEPALIRLTHILGGYEYSRVKGFSPVFEYDKEEEEGTISEVLFEQFFGNLKDFSQIHIEYRPLNGETVEIPSESLYTYSGDTRIPVLDYLQMADLNAKAEWRSDAWGDDILDSHRLFLRSDGTDEELSLSDYLWIGKAYHNNDLRFVYSPDLADAEECEREETQRKKYHFEDNRPTELLLFSTRNKPGVERKKGGLGKGQSIVPFWETNRYPSCCRFLYMDVMRNDNLRFEQDLLQYWLAVMVLAHNHLGSSTFKAYYLYQICVELDEAKLCRALNQQNNGLDAANNAVKMELQRAGELSFSANEKIFTVEPVTIHFNRDDALKKGNEVKVSAVMEDRKQGLQDIEAKNREVAHEIDKKTVNNKRRELDRAVRDIRKRSFDFLPQKYYLDDYQIKDLRKLKRDYERRILHSGSHSPDKYEARWNKIGEENLREHDAITRDEKVEQEKSVGTAWYKAILVACCLVIVGNATYIVQSATLKPFSWSKNIPVLLGALLVTVFIIGLGLLCSYIAFCKYKKNVDETNAKLNKRRHAIEEKYRDGEQSFSDFYTDLLTYRKLQSIYRGMNYREESDLKIRKCLIEYSRAIQNGIRRNEKWLRLYGVERNPMPMTYTQGFDVPPRKNPIFYFEPTEDEPLARLNETEEIACVYPFVKHVWIARDYLSDGDSDNTGEIE